jgi:hypothetical protein
MLHSLSLLASFVQYDSAWQRVQAFYADVPTSRVRSIVVIERIAGRYGFEVRPQPRAWWHIIQEVFEGFLLRLLAYGYNPTAMRRQPFIRRRWRIWITRSRLIQFYGAAA